MTLREETRYRVKEKGKESEASLTLGKETRYRVKEKRKGVGSQFDLEERNNVLSQRK